MKFKLPIFALLALFIGSTSCSKDDEIVTPPTKTQILTAHTWKVDENYNSDGGTLYHYKRGGATNFPAPGLDAIRYTFLTDHTGTYTDGYGSTHDIDWEFSSTDETNMLVTFHLGATPTPYNWSMVNITENTVLVTAYAPNQDLLVSSKMVPVL